MHGKEKGVWIASMWVVLLIALGVRILRASTEPFVNMDVIRFIRQGQRLFTDPVGAMRGEVYHPLHSFLGRVVHDLVTCHLVADDRFAWIAAMKTVGIAAAVGVTWLIMRVSRHFGAPWWAAAGAGLLWAVGRRASTYGADGLSDCLFLFLFGSAILLAIRGHMRPGLWRWLGIGAVSGLAYLARPEGVAAIVILGATLVQLRVRDLVRRRSGTWLDLTPVRCGVWMVIGFMVVGVPYMGVIGRFTGKKSVTISEVRDTGWDKWVGGAASRGGMPLAEVQSSVMAPKSMAGRIVMEVGETFGWAALLIMGLAIAIKPRAWGRAQWRGLVFIWMGFWVVVMIWVISKTRTVAHPEGYLDGRHTLVLQFLLHALFGLALQVWLLPMAWWQAWWRHKEAWARLPAWRRWDRWPYVESAVVLALACMPGVIMLKDPPAWDKVYLREAADWLAANTAGDVVIGFREPTLSYYANRGFAETTGAPTDAEAANLRGSHPGGKVVLACIFQEGRGESVPEEMGGMVEIKRFVSRGALHGDVLVIYAMRGANVQRMGMPG